MKDIVTAIRDLVKPDNRSDRLPFTSGSGALGGLYSAKPGPTYAQLCAMGMDHTVFGIIDSTSANTAAVDWKLYRKQTDQRRSRGPVEEARTEIVKHPVVDLWNRPNPYMQRSLFVESVQQHFESTGEMWWLIVTDGLGLNIPTELWPIRPDKMEPVPGKTEYLLGYVYHGPRGEDVPLGLDDVIFVRRPNPADPYRGIGAVQTILTEIQGVKLSAEYNRNFFANSAEPGGYVKFKHRLGDDEWNEFQERWAEGHRGVRNAHRVATLESDADWVESKITHRDMQFVEYLQNNRETIRGAFRFPKPMLGAVDDVNRANAEAAEVVFARWYIKERCDRLKGALNTQLLLNQMGEPRFPGGDVLEFDYINPVPEDREADNAELTAKVNAVKVLVDTGFDPDDACDFVGIPRMKFERPAAQVNAGPGTTAEGEGGDSNGATSNGLAKALANGKTGTKQLVPYRE